MGVSLNSTRVHLSWCNDAHRELLMEGLEEDAEDNVVTTSSSDDVSIAEAEGDGSARGPILAWVDNDVI